jgi:hypothetical protein
MRSLAILSAAALLALAVACAAQPAAGRPFWQTYGSTVPLPGGGCGWNMNSDYFVPRHCDSGRYDLFSPCKTSHYKSPACMRMHPTYGGYCTPFTGWHYLRKDHVYAKHCGCTPWKSVYGSWHLDKCARGCGVLKHHRGCGAAGCGGPSCGAAGCGGFDMLAAGAATCDAGFAAANLGGYGEFDDAYALPNVEPMGGTPLGEIAALPAAMMGGGSGMLGTGAGQTLPMPAGLPAGGASFSLPGLFGN